MVVVIVLPTAIVAVIVCILVVIVTRFKIMGACLSRRRFAP